MNERASRGGGVGETGRVWGAQEGSSENVGMAAGKVSKELEQPLCVKLRALVG